MEKNNKKIVIVILSLSAIGLLIALPGAFGILPIEGIYKIVYIMGLSLAILGGIVGGLLWILAEGLK